MRDELHPQGFEVVTVSLELSGNDASRPYIEAAAPEHPSLIDASHQLDALFGVVNIPNVIWIDEAGMIVRPSEPGWGLPSPMPESFMSYLGERMQAQAERAAAAGEELPDIMGLVTTGQDRATYPDAIRDWVANGAASQFSLDPAEVVARSHPRPPGVSAAAAHFELANHLWGQSDRAGAIAHFNEAHRLQPENWTYKRQAWSMVGNEQVGGDFGRFEQGPTPGAESEWPFDSDFNADIAKLEAGQYYPNTM